MSLDSGLGATLGRALDHRLEEHLRDSYEGRLEGLCAFVRIPSVSALPEYTEACRSAAAWLANELTKAGLEHVELLPTTGHPVVYADWLHAADAPTVLVYTHYDVQPVDPLDAWSSPPFEPQIDGHRLVGRGTSDAKAQALIHLWAIEGLLRTRGELPVNVRVIVEGDEESGSGGLEQWLKDHQQLLSADLGVVSDTSFFEGNLPSVTIGLRGICYLQVDVYGALTDLHSGANGGAIANPANALCEVVASLKTADGGIAVEGFYDDVLPLSEVDRSAIAALPFDDDSYRRSIGASALWGEQGYTTIERLTARPTLDLCGLWGGFQGNGQKTIIPAEAHAKINCRLVPEQDPDRVFALLRDHIARVAPPGVRIDVQYLSGGIPTILSIDHPATLAASRALASVFGVAPLYVRKGSSVPASAALQSALRVPVVLLGFTPPDNRAHAPNEWMDLVNFEKGIRAVACYWDELGALSPAALNRAGRAEETRS